jgi:hypothetical protein
MNRTIAALFALSLALPVSGLAQWPRFTAPGTPMKDGKPDLTAPAPRTSDGKVDMSGVWEIAPQGPPAQRPATAAAGTGEAPPNLNESIFFNVGAQTPGGAPYQPWAAELRKKRMADNSKDNPDALCLPLGIMQNTTHPYPRKIIQTPTEVIIIYEGSGTTVREIFMDGRPLPPKDAQPWWHGYSVGRWEGDTLVVESTNFLDGGWLDVTGSPLTDQGRLIERISRPNFGSLRIDVTVDDPKAYTKPFSLSVNYRISTDTQLIEFVCHNNVSAQHYVGASGKPEPAK